MGVELNYLPCVQMSCFSHVWTPYPNWGAFPPTTVVGGSRGTVAIVQAPPGPPCSCSGGEILPTPPVGAWGPNPDETRHLNTRKIIRLHTQQSPTWRLIIVTSPQLHLLDYPLTLDLEIFSSSPSYLKAN